MAQAHHVDSEVEQTAAVAEVVCSVVLHLQEAEVVPHYEAA
jgi:hypothetical protein